MSEVDPNIPNGVIYAPQPEDWAEGDGNLEEHFSRVLLESGDYTPYAPRGERQSAPGYETNNCTAFGYTNSIETQFNILRGAVSAEDTIWLKDNGYLDENGELNLSDRALGSMSGTSGNGNSLNKVADTARTQGLVPESKWPSLGHFTNNAEYFKSVPQELKTLALEFLDHFSLPYKQVFGPIYPDGMKAAPLYVALRTCSPWNGNNPPPVPWCNAGNQTNHAVCLLKTQDYRVFDSYEPYVKNLSTDYNIPYFYKVLLIPKNMNQTKVVKSKDGKTLYLCTPIATDFQNFKKQASVEGIIIPDPIPPASTL